MISDDDANGAQVSTASKTVSSRLSWVALPGSFVVTILLGYSGRRVGGSVRRPVITLITHSFTYDAIWKGVTERYPYQHFVGRAAPGAIKRACFNCEGYTFPVS